MKFLEQCVDMLVLFNCVYEDVCDALQGQREISVVNQKQHTQIVFLSLSASLEASPQTPGETDRAAFPYLSGF